MDASFLLALLLALPTVSAAAKSPAPVAAPAQPVARHEPHADSLLARADAERWLDGTLEDTFTQEEQPIAENGHDHMTVRGWYPKGWNPQTADAPPERGIQAVVHAFADTAGAERFYDFIRGRDEASSRRTEGPLAGFEVQPLDSLADVAHVKHGTLKGRDGAGVSLATLAMRQGRVFVQMQVWMADGTAVERATRAAREMISKLR